MVQLPDSIKPHVATVAKHHFWILGALVPLLLLPAVFSANALMRKTIAGERAKIDGHVSALRGIRNEPDHPNDRWVKAVDGRTKAIREEMLGEWRRFWDGQQSLRAWPQQLGPEFLAEMGRVESGNQPELILQNRLRYRDTVPDLVRLLPERMGCQELMSDRDGAEGLIPGGSSRLGPGGIEDEQDSPEASLRLDPLVWRSEDQRRLLASFLWTGEPSTTKVRLAQEELWVYGLFCDAIKKLNTGAKGAFDATITTVEELAVGYPAAEEIPGGRGGGRILWKVDPTATGQGGEAEVEGMPAMDGGMEEGGARRAGPVGKPPNPRFTPSSGGMEAGGLVGRRPGGSRSSSAPTESGSGEGDDAAELSPDDALRQWIYVDFEGRPLTAAEQQTTPDAQMVHLMPFAIRVVMDQRKIDLLLRELAGGDVPIDVRQVRINPSSQAAGSGGPLGAQGAIAGGREFGGESGLGDQRRRPFDVTLELRGTVGLAVPPDEKVFGAPLGVDEEGGGP